MAVDDLTQALTVLRASDTTQLLGTRESVWIDFKSAPYNLAEQHQLEEFCKDVAAMANWNGGLLVIGVRTTSTPDGEVASKLRPIHRRLADPERYADVLAEWVLGRMSGVECFWVPCQDAEATAAPDDAQDRGLLVVYVPEQPDPAKPFAVVRATLSSKDRHSGALTIGIPIREGAGVRWVRPEELHRVISTSWSTGDGLDPPDGTDMLMSTEHQHFPLPLAPQLAFNQMYRQTIGAGAAVVALRGAVGAALQSTPHSALTFAGPERSAILNTVDISDLRARASRLLTGSLDACCLTEEWEEDPDISQTRTAAAYRRGLLLEGEQVARLAVCVFAPWHPRDESRIAVDLLIDVVPEAQLGRLLSLVDTVCFIDAALASSVAVADALAGLSGQESHRVSELSARPPLPSRSEAHIVAATTNGLPSGIASAFELAPLGRGRPGTTHAMFLADAHLAVRAGPERKEWLLRELRNQLLDWGFTDPDPGLTDLRAKLLGEPEG